MCLFWNGCLVYLLWGSSPLWKSLVFSLAHIAVGIGIAYFTLATLVNKTRIRVSGGRLRVMHGPLPWRGNRDLASSSVRQIYSEEQLKSSSKAPVRYSVNAVVDDGATLVLVKDLPASRQALYIEQVLEAHLGIADEHVPGALSREHAR